MTAAIRGALRHNVRQCRRKNAGCSLLARLIECVSTLRQWRRSQCPLDRSKSQLVAGLITAHATRLPASPVAIVCSSGPGLPSTV